MWDETDDPEPVSDLLVLGILFFPALFVWFLFARRYSREIRIGASIYALIAVAGLVAALWTMAGRA